MANKNTCPMDVSLGDIDWGFTPHSSPVSSARLYSMNSVVSAFTALAVWSSIPLTLRLLFTFQRYRGLYFWSIFVTTWAINVRAIGFLLRYIIPAAPWILGLTLFELGWVGMVSGFSVVLYSRLSILIQSRLALQLTLAMIIVDGICLHTTVIVLVFGGSAQPADEAQKRTQWLAASNVMERLQIVWFTVQDGIISYLYMKAAWDHVHGSFLSNQSTRMVLRWLIAVQIMVLTIDVVLAVIDCIGYFAVKAIIYPFIYSIKLELEFVILNQLVTISRQGLRSPSSMSPEFEFRLPNASMTAPVLPTATGLREKSGCVSPQLNLDLFSPITPSPRRNISVKDDLDIEQNRESYP